ARRLTRERILQHVQPVAQAVSAHLAATKAAAVTGPTFGTVRSRLTRASVAVTVSIRSSESPASRFPPGQSHLVLSPGLGQCVRALPSNSFTPARRAPIGRRF